MAKIYITVGWEVVLRGGDHPIGLWLVVNGKRLEYIPLPEAFPFLPETLN
jgi:hypothetical protein